jgi:hypothetical protein
MCFKYFLSCGESDLVKDGKLLLEPLGEAAVALRDCTRLTSQVTVQSVNAVYGLGPGVMIDPHPGDGSRPGDTRPPPCSGENAWKWLPFETGLVKPNALGVPERVQGLIGYDPKVSGTQFKPESLRRRRVILGIDVKGVGDTKWLIPIARSPVMAYGFLATRFAPAPGGQWERKIEKEDQALWDLSGEVQDYLIWVRNEAADPQPQWADPWSINVTLQVLGVNYRIGRPELSALEAMEANPITPFFSICVLHGLTGRAEWEAWLRELQKKSSEGTSPALEDSTYGSGELADRQAGQAALDAVLAEEN